MCFHWWFSHYGGQSSYKDLSMTIVGSIGMAEDVAILDMAVIENCGF